MAAADAKTAPGGDSPKSPLILVLLNTLALLGAMGGLVYTKVIYKRPVITEESERARLEKIQEAQSEEIETALVRFEPTTINIAANPMRPKPADGTSRQIEGKLHYATIGFALEIRDARHKEDVEAVRPMIMDKVIGMLGRRQFNELNNVQGRYVLRTQLIEAANRIIAENAGRIAHEAIRGDGKAEPKPRRPPIAVSGETLDDLVTNAYFTQFIVQ